jgi:RNA polymerase sigma factor (sigma-70 family)
MNVVHQADQRLINALRATAYSLFPTLRDHVEDIVQEAFIRAAEATWDWSPSKAYLKKCVRSAGIKLIEYRNQHQREIPVDFQYLDSMMNTVESREGEDIGDADVWDPPTTWQDQLPIPRSPRRLTRVEQAVVRALWEYAVDEPGEVDLQDDVWQQFSQDDREFLQDYFVEGLTERRLASKYGLSKTTVHRRLKDLAYRSKDLTKPARPKRPKTTNGPDPVMELRADHRPENPIPA